MLEALPFGVRIAIAAGQAGMTKLFGFAGRVVDLRVLPPPLLVVVLSAGYRYQHGAGIRLLRGRMSIENESGSELTKSESHNLKLYEGYKRPSGDVCDRGRPSCHRAVVVVALRSAPAKRYDVRVEHKR